MQQSLSLIVYDSALTLQHIEPAEKLPISIPRILRQQPAITKIARNRLVDPHVSPHYTCIRIGLEGQGKEVSGILARNLLQGKTVRP